VETPTQTANRQIARGAGVVMAAFILSNLVGLVRQVLISRAFGTQTEIDAFNAAARLPDTLFMLVAGGALASSFLPVFTEFLTKEDRQSAWHLASALINMVLLVLAVGSMFAAFFAPWIVSRFLAPYFPAGQQALTVSLLRILLVSPVIFGVSGLSMGVLNAHQKFLLPALAPTMYWLGMIFGVLFLTPSLGIHGLAWGAVLGAGGHLGVQLPGVIRLKGRYQFTLGLDSPAVRRVGALLGPRLFGVAVVQLNFWVNTILASGQPVGSLTAIQIAFAVMTMPQVVIAQAIAIAALPTFSEQAARGKLGEMRESLAATLRGVILLSLPASLGLILLRFPIVALLFERGEFDAHSTSLVAWALLWYAAGLVGHSVVEVVSRAFYALHDTKTPVVVGVIAMSLNVAFSIAFAAWFAQTGLPPHGGLALGNSLATALEMVALLALMARRLDGLEGRNVWVGGLQAGAATLGMSLALLWWLGATGGAANWLVGLGGIAVGGLAYAVLIYAQRVPEARELMRYALGRLNRIKA
jgi:putative peptidoglycan lipid II flippase